MENFSFHTDAVSFLEETILNTHCSVIALGPMTNLARLIQKNPAAFAAIDELVSMGGAFKSHGNCSPVAEYNYWQILMLLRLSMRQQPDKSVLSIWLASM